MRKFIICGLISLILLVPSIVNALGIDCGPAFILPAIFTIGGVIFLIFLIVFLILFFRYQKRKKDPNLKAKFPALILCIAIFLLIISLASYYEQYSGGSIATRFDYCLQWQQVRGNDDNFVNKKSLNIDELTNRDTVKSLYDKVSKEGSYSEDIKPRIFLGTDGGKVIYEVNYGIISGSYGGITDTYPLYYYSSGDRVYKNLKRFQWDERNLISYFNL